MDGMNWPELDEKKLEEFSRRIALVETLSDDHIDENERFQVRQDYLREQGVSDRTIRNYLKRYREEGPRGLLFRRRGVPLPSARIHDEALRRKVLSLIEERPSRTIPQVRRMLERNPEFAPKIARVSNRTIYRFLNEHGLSQKARTAKRTDGGRRSFHQFQASASMELVQGDGRDGIWLPDPERTGGGQRKTYLFAWVDDYSRKILFAKYFWDEKLPRMEETFKTMVLRWGIPLKVYLDNGSVYCAAQFAFILTQLTTKKIHHGPYQAWCKGKVEAVMKTLKNEFQAEAQRAGFQTLDELNSALWAWIDVEYNRRNHSSTGQPPFDRFLTGLPCEHRRISDLEWFEALFLLREHRTVSKYGIVKLCGNHYNSQVSHGSIVEVRYNPFDLRSAWRFENGRRVETLGLRKLVHEIAVGVPEERKSAPVELSAEAAGYFAKLREHQAELRAAADTPQYSKLKAGPT